MSDIGLSVSLTQFSDTNIAEILADKLWDDDGVDRLAELIFDECETQENEDNLEALCRRLLERLNATGKAVA